MLLVVIIGVIAALSAFNKKNRYSGKYQEKEIVSCGSALTDIMAGDNGKFIPLLQGWGHHRYTITTSNDSTQIYFNQGLNFYYSYHFREALASFKEAARFDAGCAMVYWGQALSMGPYYNNYYYRMNREVPGIISKMTSLVSAASAKEQALVTAMQKRYSSDTTNADRVQLDRNYAAAMSLLTQQYTGDDDIKALYVDAVMLEHKWDFWYNNGRPKEWTPELVKFCEAILQNDPAHPAALHYHIHLTEASKHPERALHSADVLKETLPGVGHMVHMSTHMYQRNGLFAKGVYVNEDANDRNNRVDSLVPNLKIGKNSSLHFYDVQSYCAMNAGMYDKALPLYNRARKRLLELRSSIGEEPGLQSIYMIPVIAAVRMGKWSDILQSSDPDNTWKYAAVLNDFAKGLAYVHNKDLVSAKKCLDNLERKMADSVLNIREMPFNKPVQCCKVAAGILKGELLFAEGKTSSAIDAFKQAVGEEDNLIYSEPKDWLVPSRQYLGACLLKLNKAKEAESVYREDLVMNPGNGWSLVGMYNSLLEQNKAAEASRFKSRYLKAFEAADAVPTASVF